MVIDMKKILFLIHDLGQGGAEKVLINLVNNMDCKKFNITVFAIFGGGINEQFLDKKICYKYIFNKMIPGNSKIMKLFSPKLLHSLFIKEKYDIEVSYLEGPCARIISGCKDENIKKVSWIHVEQHDIKNLSLSFRSQREARKCYDSFDKTIAVSEFVKKDFTSILSYKKPCEVLYNVVESDKIRQLSYEDVILNNRENYIKLIAVGTLKKSKGYMRLLKIARKLKDEGYLFHLYILGVGPLNEYIKNYISKYDLKNNIILLGYHINPYKFISNCDLFICASYSEGFSTAATESLILGTPVCTVEVSGMKEMLGENNEFGIVTQNTEEELYEGIKKLMDSPQLLKYYKSQALIRGRKFNTTSTVTAVEEMFLSL